jgi:hypothetical protein
MTNGIRHRKNDVGNTADDVRYMQKDVGYMPFCLPKRYSPFTSMAGNSILNKL